MVKPSIFFVCLVSASFGSGVARADGMATPVSAFLCDTSVHAVLFATLKADGEGDEMARDRVGRMAQGEVCGLYRGVATIESESVVLKNGVAYKVTAFRFKEDRKVAWLAETTFAPAHAAWDL